MRWGRIAAAIVASCSLLVLLPDRAWACLPLDPPSDWSFSEGLAVGFVGHVVEVRDDSRLSVPRTEVIIEVDHILAGTPTARVSIIRGEPYCDSLPYEIGDRLVVAGGRQVGDDYWYEEFGLGPPYNRYNVAVWGPFNRAVEDLGPTLYKDPVGSDIDSLVARLEVLPNTAVRAAVHASAEVGIVVAVVAGIGLVVASLVLAARRRIRVR